MQFINLIIAELTSIQIDRILSQVDLLLSVIIKVGGVIGLLITSIGIPYLAHRQSKNNTERIKAVGELAEKVDKNAAVIVVKVDENTAMNKDALDAANNVTNKADASHQTAAAAMEVATAALNAATSTPSHVIVDNDEEHSIPVKTPQ